MSREDNQGTPLPQSSGSVVSGAETSEGSHRITINDPSSSTNTRRSYQTPTSPTSSTSKLRRRRSTYNENDDDDDDYDDDDNDDDYDSDGSRKRKRKDLKRRLSHRRKSGSAASNAEEDIIDGENQNDEDDENESDHEYTLKDRQEAINTAHPFGLPIWKPALYKKSRTVERNADSALHSIPSSDLYLSPGNILWALCFGWWLALISFTASIALFLTPFGGRKYGKVLRELSYYIFWPFGKFVEEERTESEEQPTDYFSYRDSSVGDMDSDSENRPLLGRMGSRSEKFNLFEKLDEIGISGVVFYFWFFLVIAPTFLIVSAICWFAVFPIPMAKLTYVLLGYLRKHPLKIHFKPGSYRSSSTSVLLCTDKAFGLQYYKYTYDGINIMFINLMAVVFFVITDDRFLKKKFPDYFFATEEFIFALSLASVIPLSYFIGTAVASISAQSSIGMGAVINATFGSIVEIILYAIALNKGNGKLTEGSIIGSFMAGVLLMPGVSMISGGLKKKEQKFNAKSAGVTSTMLIMAIIGALTPTLFYQTYAPYKMTCEPCGKQDELLNAYSSCQVCSHSEVEPTETSLYKERVKPLMFFCATILILSYLTGLWFTLRTHASLVYQTPHQNELRPQSIYHRLVPMNIITQLLPQTPSFFHYHQHQNLNPSQNPIPGMPLQRPMSAPNADGQNPHQYGSVENTIHLANVASGLQNPQMMENEEEEHISGHDSPNWSKVKSGIVLLSCTLLYSFIAEILVENVRFVLNHVSVSEKILGLTLFALVPNVTEFLNAMLFSLYGNIALSMEIGSAYALQVCLLQIPAMVAYSAYLNKGKTDDEQRDHTFTLVFPRWDVFSVVFSVFLLTYTYIEGKSNYFKGSILILSYLVLMAGFFYAPDSRYDSYGMSM